MSEHFEISERLAKILHRTVLSVLGLAAILAVITMNLMLLPLRHPEVPVWFWIIFLALLFLAGAVVVIVVLALYFLPAIISSYRKHDNNRRRLRVQSFVRLDHTGLDCRVGMGHDCKTVQEPGSVPDVCRALNKPAVAATTSPSAVSARSREISRR
jgi:hypothetical protein